MKPDPLGLARLSAEDVRRMRDDAKARAKNLQRDAGLLHKLARTYERELRIRRKAEKTDP